MTTEVMCGSASGSRVLKRLKRLWDRDRRNLTRDQIVAALGALVLVAFISYSVGLSSGFDTGYDTGYDYGYDAGEEAGYEKGYEEGYSKGEDDGAKQGYSSGYDDGYSDGYSAGGSSGYSDGYSEGFTDGCESVFEGVGYYDYVTAYSPFSFSNKYPGRTYVAKYNC